MCATVHVRHATTDRNTRALPTRGHARPRVRRAGRRIANFWAHRSLCYRMRARWPHVGTPAHVCTVYGRSGLNLRARAGPYTTGLACFRCAFSKLSQHAREVETVLRLKTSKLGCRLELSSDFRQSVSASPSNKIRSNV